MPQGSAKTVVEAARPRDERYFIWDDTLKGFGLSVAPSGTKNFFVRYRAQGGGRTAPRRFISIGRYGTVTAIEARRKAKELLGSAALGDDPALERQNKRREMRMCDLVDLY